MDKLTTVYFPLLHNLIRANITTTLVMAQLSFDLLSLRRSNEILEIIGSLPNVHEKVDCFFKTFLFRNESNLLFIFMDFKSANLIQKGILRSKSRFGFSEEMQKPLKYRKMNSFLDSPERNQHTLNT